MKNIFRSTTILLVVGLTLIIASTVVAFPTNPTALNARFFQWQEKEEIIHIGTDSSGNSADNPAIVDVGQPIIFGHEWVSSDSTLEEQEAIYNDPEFDLFLSVDNGPFYSIREFIQPPFVMSDDCSEPRMYWDHDFDGRGDGDGDGDGDFCDIWPNAIFKFVRVPYSFADPGLHTLDIQYSEFNFGGFAWTIYIEVLEP